MSRGCVPPELGWAPSRGNHERPQEQVQVACLHPVQERNRGGGHGKRLAGMLVDHARVVPHHEPVERNHHDPGEHKNQWGQVEQRPEGRLEDVR